MSTPDDRVVAQYLGRLEDELRAVPFARRREVVLEIAVRIAEERERGAAVGELLARIGDPARIAAEARARFGERVAARAGWRELGALILLPFGGVIVPGVGWLVGAVLLWLSDAWTTREKALGTLVLPGGLLFPIYLLVAGATRGNPLLLVAAVLLMLAPLAVDAYLLRRLRS